MKPSQVGKLGERMAEDFLRRKGVAVLARNFSVHGGEIDLIGYRRGVLLFIEVKTRTGNTWGTGAEAMGEEKLRCVERAAKAFLRTHAPYGRISVPFWFGTWVSRTIRHMRIDGVEVTLHPDGTPKSINHLEDMGYEIRQHPRKD